MPSGSVIFFALLTLEFVKYFCILAVLGKLILGSFVAFPVVYVKNLRLMKVNCPTMVREVRVRKVDFLGK